MFNVDSSEVIVLGIVALLVIPPKDLPKAMRFAGHWVGKVRGVASQFRSGFDTMVREAELQDMEKKWAAENERIMREHPVEPVQMLPAVDTPGVGYDGTEGDGPPVMVEQPVMVETPAPIGPPVVVEPVIVEPVGPAHSAGPAHAAESAHIEPETKALS